MSNSLDQAIAKARALPEADQEQVARYLNSYIDDLGGLRAEVVEGIRSLDAGLRLQIDIEDIMARARATHP